MGILPDSVWSVLPACLSTTTSITTSWSGKHLDVPLQRHEERFGIYECKSTGWPTQPTRSPASPPFDCGISGRYQIVCKQRRGWMLCKTSRVLPDIGHHVE